MYIEPIGMLESLLIILSIFLLDSARYLSFITFRIIKDRCLNR